MTDEEGCRLSALRQPPPLPKGQPDVGLVNTDLFLANPEPLHSLLALLSVQHFYVRFFTLQMLSTLLQNRPPKVQDYVLTSPGGVRTVMECLEEKREILRNGPLCPDRTRKGGEADLHTPIQRPFYCSTILRSPMATCKRL